ncbi:protein ea22 [Escherichia coli H736]|nr:protein ea22 [Escherichia coli H736]
MSRWLRPSRSRIRRISLGAITFVYSVTKRGWVFPGLSVKRIAKLESNEVREDGNQFLVVRHPGKTPVIKHCTGDLEEFLRQLIEQDPLVTIDIITHRYYGVGGQWVQDAGEYLHMMSDAGIRIKGE